MPAESHPWSASLYLGVVPLLLALTTWRRVRGDPRCGWLWTVAVLAVLASFGRYGVGWIGEELGLHSAHAVADGALPGGGEAATIESQRAAGGVYWLLARVLPGYGAFRYPAKWMVVATAAVAALAAIGWDRVFTGSNDNKHNNNNHNDGDDAAMRRSLVRYSLAWSTATCFAALLLLASHHLWPTWGQRVPADPLFGPFDAVSAGWHMVFALAQVAVVSLLLAMAVQHRARFGAAAGALVLCITAVDLALAGRPLVATVPLSTGVFDVPAPRPAAPPTPRHTLPPIALPHEWRDEASDQRLTEWLAWQRSGPQPNWNLLERMPVSAVSPAVWPYAMKAYLRAGAWRGTSPAQAMAAMTSPRCWVSANVVALSTIDETDATAVARRADQVLDMLSTVDGGERRVIVETDTPRDEWAQRGPKTNAETGTNSCRIVAETTDRIEIVVTLDAPGMLVLADLYTPDWTATAETAGSVSNAEVLRVNRVMRGVALPAGSHRVTLTYRPASFTAGAAISGLAWSCLPIALFVSIRRSGSLSTTRHSRCRNVGPPPHQHQML
ncbi:MAG: hypothetical protein R3C10_27965 [Pirellulales bacterium]